MLALGVAWDDAAVIVADEGELISLDGCILLSGSFCFGKDDEDDGDD